MPGAAHRQIGSWVICHANPTILNSNCLPYGTGMGLLCQSQGLWAQHCQSTPVVQILVSSSWRFLAELLPEAWHYPLSQLVPSRSCVRHAEASCNQEPCDMGTEVMPIRALDGS